MTRLGHQRELSYSVRFRVILKYGSQLSLAVAILSLVPAAVSFAFGETEAAFQYFLVSICVSGFGALGMFMRAPRDLQANEAMVTVALTFLIAAGAMVYPFMAAGLSLSDAILEAVSGVTTTGLTTVADLGNKPASFLFTRAWMQWYGGLGIVVLWVAIGMRAGNVSKALTGLSRDEDLVGGTIAHSRRAIIVYSMLTAIGFFLLAACGVPVFVALLHTLAAVSTGGFSSFDKSLEGLPGWLGVAAVTVVSVAGAIPTMTYYNGCRRRITDLVADRQLWLLVGLGTVFGLMLIPLMPAGQSTSELGRIGNAFTTAFSAQTTSGFSTIDVHQLDPAAKVILIFSMALGGSTGSTAGGFKLLRVLILFRFVQAAFARLSLPPHAVREPRLAGHRLGYNEIQEISTYLTMGLLVVLGSWFVFVLMGYDPLDSLFEVVSATGTVGLSAGITGSQLPWLLKGVLCADMLMGRMEIVAFIVLFCPRTWIGKRRRSP